jgi:hypothetical protein
MTMNNDKTTSKRTKFTFLIVSLMTVQEARTIAKSRITTSQHANFLDEMPGSHQPKQKIYPRKVIEQKKNVIAAPTKVNSSYSKSETFSRCNQRAHVLVAKAKNQHLFLVSQ